MRAFSTARLYFRELSESECSPAYVAWLNDPEVCRFLETRHQMQTMDAVRAFVQEMRLRPDVFLFGIFLDGEHIGNVKIGPIDSIHRVGDMSIVIGQKSLWRQGYGTEAMRGLAEYALSKLGVEKVNASVYDGNVGSITALRRAGYVQEGLLRSNYILDGFRTDILLFGILHSDVVAS